MRWPRCRTSTRIAWELMGWSWGGYAVMWLRGALDALQGHGLDDGRLRPPVDVQLDRGAVVPALGPRRGAPWESPAHYQRVSPSSYVTGFKTPVPRHHGREGLPRPLLAVADVLHRPAEARRPLAAPRLRERRALAGLVRDGALLRGPPRLVPPLPGRRSLALRPARAGSRRRLREQAESPNPGRTSERSRRPR